MDVRYRCCEHCKQPCLGRRPRPDGISGHVVPCARPGCPGRMPIDPETEG